MLCVGPVDADEGGEVGHSILLRRVFSAKRDVLTVAGRKIYSKAARERHHLSIH